MDRKEKNLQAYIHTLCLQITLEKTLWKTSKSPNQVCFYFIIFWLTQLSILLGLWDDGICSAAGIPGCSQRVYEFSKRVFAYTLFFAFGDLPDRVSSPVVLQFCKLVGKILEISAQIAGIN